ncbi:MAG TPA: universal stress protein [Thermoleophilia bacterium]|nr:universal stress protein [Thermoleophilia bacterium]
MALYRRILVPLDGTDVDDAILDHVAELARLCGAEVVLLRVAHFHTRDTMAHEVEDAGAQLQHTAGELAERGLCVSTVIGRGEPVDVIVEKARQYAIDLIAMATHGHGRLPRMVYGSVAEQVRHKTNVPLLLVKATPGPVRPTPSGRGSPSED